MIVHIYLIRDSAIQITTAYILADKIAGSVPIILAVPPALLPTPATRAVPQAQAHPPALQTALLQIQVHQAVPVHHPDRQAVPALPAPALQAVLHPPVLQAVQAQEVRLVPAPEVMFARVVVPQITCALLHIPTMMAVVYFIRTNFALIRNA